MRTRTLTALAVGFGLAFAPAFAQETDATQGAEPAQGAETTQDAEATQDAGKKKDKKDKQVRVKLDRVRDDVAKQLNTSVANVPITILIPINIAVNICSVEAAALAEQTTPELNCVATNSSLVTQIVQNMIDSGGAAQPEQPAEPAPEQASATPDAGATAAEPAAPEAGAEAQPQ